MCGVCIEKPKQKFFHAYPSDIYLLKTYNYFVQRIQQTQQSKMLGAMAKELIPPLRNTQSWRAGKRGMYVNNWRTEEMF